MPIIPLPFRLVFENPLPDGSNIRRTGLSVKEKEREKYPSLPRLIFRGSGVNTFLSPQTEREGEETYICTHLNPPPSREEGYCYSYNSRVASGVWYYG
jgi:hypothetical protein